jgi:hypothetical protein
VRLFQQIRDALHGRCGTFGNGLDQFSQAFLGGLPRRDDTPSMPHALLWTDPQCDPAGALGIKQLLYSN